MFEPQFTKWEKILKYIIYFCLFWLSIYFIILSTNKIYYSFIYPINLSQKQDICTIPNNIGATIMFRKDSFVITDIKEWSSLDQVEIELRQQ